MWTNVKHIFILLISFSLVSSNALPETTSYTVKSGDTLGKILFNLKSKKIYGSNGHLVKTLSLNSLSKGGDDIYPGMKIIIPFRPEEHNQLDTNLFSNINIPLSKDQSFYIVKEGETLSGILYTLNIKHIYGFKGNLLKLLTLNNFKNTNSKVYPGMKIILPVAVTVQQEQLSGRAISSLADIPLPVVIDQNSPADAPSSLSIQTPSSPKAKPRTEEASKTISAEEDYGQFYFFRLAPQVSWLRIVSTESSKFQNSNITANSKSNIGGLLTFGIQVDEKVKIQAFSYLSSVNFYESDEFTFSKISFFRQAYGLGGDYKLNDKVRFSLKVGYFDEFFLSMNSSTNINVEIGQIPEIHWGARYLLGQHKKVIFDSGLFGKFILPHKVSTIDGKFGYGLGGDVLCMFNGNKGLRFFYNYSHAKATSKITTTSEIGWNLMFEAKYFE